MGRLSPEFWALEVKAVFAQDSWDSPHWSFQPEDLHRERAGLQNHQEEKTQSFRNADVHLLLVLLI